MATTTNYGWATPDDTDLVKDGAAAIRTLGSSADTTVKALSPGTTAGDLDYYTSGTAKARLAIGTAGQILKVNSGATAPEWGDAAASGLNLIQAPTTFTGVSSQSINNVFTSTYTNYRVIVIFTSSSNPGNLVNLRFRVGGVDTSVNYSGQRIFGSNTTVGAGRNSSGTDDHCTGGETGDSNPLIMDIFNPQAAAQTQILTEGWSNAASTARSLSGGRQSDATQFDGFTLFAAVGTFGGVITIYGLAN
jgi:hypothetical protein